MRPEDFDLYRVVERRLGGGLTKYVAFKPRLGPNGLEWDCNAFDNQTRYEAGAWEDRGERGFAFLPSQAGRPLCVFEPLSLKNVKELTLFAMNGLDADWDEDLDVLMFFRAYFKNLEPEVALEPAEVRLAPEEIWRRMDHVFLETRGVEAEVGAIHRWRTGDFQKQADHSWRKVGSEFTGRWHQGATPAESGWADTHPSIPKSTKEKYFNPATVSWTPERLKMQEAVLDDVRAEAFKGVTPVPDDEEPTFTFIMGPPAAGKSTHQGNQYHNSATLDPDEIVVRLPEFQEAARLKTRSGATSVVDEALQMNNRLIEEAKKRHCNFVLSGTGANLKWMLETLIPNLKKLPSGKRGYKINLVMAYVEDEDELLLRSEARGHKNMRFIPPPRTKHLHEVLPRNFKALMAIPEVNTMALMDSHVAPDERGGFTPRLIFSQSRVGGAVKQHYGDASYFERVVQSQKATEIP